MWRREPPRPRSASTAGRRQRRPGAAGVAGGRAPTPSSRRGPRRAGRARPRPGRAPGPRSSSSPAPRSSVARRRRAQVAQLHARPASPARCASPAASPARGCSPCWASGLVPTATTTAARLSAGCGAYACAPRSSWPAGGRAPRPSTPGPRRRPPRAGSASPVLRRLAPVHSVQTREHRTVRRIW